jgi:hypothetical protein
MTKNPAANNPSPTKKKCRIEFFYAIDFNFKKVRLGYQIGMLPTLRDSLEILQQSAGSVGINLNYNWSFFLELEV